MLIVSSPLAMAPGLDLLEGIFNDNPPVSEDCLYINAFAPASSPPGHGRPVVLFISGGGFQQGHGRYDLSGFAAYEDIIAISFNYRTNSTSSLYSKLPVQTKLTQLYSLRLSQWSEHSRRGEKSRFARSTPRHRMGADQRGGIRRRP